MMIKLYQVRLIFLLIILFWVWKEMRCLCYIVCLLIYLLYIKQLHSLSSCPSIRYFFCFFLICFILNLSFVILLFEVYLCNKFINRLQMAGIYNSNIVIKYEYDLIIPIRHFCFMFSVLFVFCNWSLLNWLNKVPLKFLRQKQKDKAQFLLQGSLWAHVILLTQIIARLISQSACASTCDTSLGQKLTIISEFQL